MVVYVNKMLPQGKDKDKKNLHSEAINHYVATFQGVSIRRQEGWRPQMFQVFSFLHQLLLFGMPQAHKHLQLLKKTLW